jgi:hypothetical protein
MEGTPNHNLPCNQNWITHNKFQDCLKFGIYAVDGSYACQFSYNNFEGHTQTALYLSGHDNEINFCHYEVGESTALHIESGYYNVVIVANTAGGTGRIVDNGTNTIFIHPRGGRAASQSNTLP